MRGGGKVYGAHVVLIGKGERLRGGGLGVRFRDYVIIEQFLCGKYSMGRFRDFTKIELLRLCDKTAGSIPALSIVVILNLSTTKIIRRGGMVL